MGFFWDGAFVEVNICRLWRKIIVTEVYVVIGAILVPIKYLVLLFYPKPNAKGLLFGVCNKLKNHFVKEDQVLG